MRNLRLHILILLVTIAAFTWAIIPPDTRLKRDKDLAGGSTLVYQVDIKATDPPDTLARVKDLISRRLDPDGALGISLVEQSGNRIEITMPLPNDAMKRLKADFEESLTALGETAVSNSRFDAVMAISGTDRATELARLSGGDTERTARFSAAAAAYDALVAERARVAGTTEQLRSQIVASQREYDAAVAAGKEQALLTVLEQNLDKLKDQEFAASFSAGAAMKAYEDAKKSALSAVLSAPEMRRVLELSDVDPKFLNAQGQRVAVDSPRKKAIARLKESHPGAVAQIDRIVEKWNTYQKQRKTLDDPADVKRLLRGAGVLDFRITAKPGEVPGESELRAKLRQGGAASVFGGEQRWFKLNKIETWFNSPADFERFDESPSGFFGERGYVVEVFDGEPYMLCYDVPGMRLTQAEGSWAVTGAGRTSDDIGRAAVRFDMDPLGASKLGELTGTNVGRQMAVLLDDQVYTAPTLQSRISAQGRITGVESAEVEYIVRVLGAGSMAAKLSPNPVSESTIGPDLGADNLDRGLKAGFISFVLVAAFMVVYYFGCGLVSVLALLVNGVLILGIMAVNGWVFSLPGIAGIVLTFGMAVDANVLIYERMREEMTQGTEFRTSVRLGYSRAMASIVDGNITVIIVCVVLLFFGSREIRGFGLTMLVGSLTTFFTQLYMTRVLFYVLVEKWGWRKGSMLALKLPFIARAFTPKVDWMGLRHIMLGFSTLAVGASIYLLLNRGVEIFDNDFRGGTRVEIALRPGVDGVPMLMTRDEAEDRARKASLPGGKVVAVNPSRDDPNKSNRFAIKTTERDSALVQERVIGVFGDVLDIQPPVRFAGEQERDPAKFAVRPVLSDTLGEVVGVPALGENVSEFRGGAAVMVNGLSPVQSLAQLEKRVRQTKADSAHEASRARQHRWFVIDGDADAVRSAVLLVRDEAVDYTRDPARWDASIRTEEWKLVVDALTRSTSLAGVESFSAAIAKSFAIDAVLSVFFSAVMIVMYIWLRFQSFRYSFGAILKTAHDCMVALGALAICEPILLNYPAVAHALGLGAFKIDLAMTAAVLTILGYSLNDTVIVMDRIRETKGKAPFASRKVVNDAINQTISRTVITSGLTMFATLALYMVGGEAIRPFAFTFMVGVVTGTYSSIFIAAPLVWVRKADPTENHGAPAGAVAA